MYFFDFQIPMNMVIDARPIFFIKFTDPSQHGHIISEIILLVFRIRINFHNIFDNIDQRLEIHLKYINLFLMLFYLLFVDVALVHEFVLVFFLDFLLLHCQLVYLKLYSYLLCSIETLFHSLDCLLVLISTRLASSGSLMTPFYRLIQVVITSYRLEIMDHFLVLP